MRMLTGSQFQRMSWRNCFLIWPRWWLAAGFIQKIVTKEKKRLKLTPRGFSAWDLCGRRKYMAHAEQEGTKETRRCSTNRMQSCGRAKEWRICVIGWSIHWNIWSIQNERMKTGITHNFLLFSIFYEFQINDIWKNRKSRAFWEKAKMDFFKFVKFSENKKISLERCLWETGKNEAYNERKYYFFLQTTKHKSKAESK